ncbi:thioredoxin family protein [Paraburkholderia caballeronis]|uniref:AhpC/TSA family protein n=1 Tax=Paraburkholderia caballeronis TaxID=416943 RepID=A0A1H7LMY0_9BURK|nr:thioredoxin family protein [Paraburkholderia caballeronis]PXW28528.1 AhpC/TSA family protein [Paraburkholderia caballeronis]PXX03894.1 AhpC/TSA family protein [Paraburkholderia caballeronis]RAK04638.1 AhpC/TSA family protein [Paraburkholderia caballeronis]SED71706.1 AhpC/TSA family protein [Paraburkholderia caballeronis]SEL00266.1 AhpC/TSA family protein [Paraburkholderia caballeronis]
MATEAPPGELGMAAPPFALRATDGRTYTLADVRGARGVVIAFICNHCPYVKAVLPAMVRDALALRSFGIGFVGINANDAVEYPDDSFDAMVALAEDAELPFFYLHDDTQEVARAYGAVCTPEFFGFDARLRLRYRGRLDASRRSAVAGARRELFDAMREVALTGAASGEQMPALGCSIKWK